MERREDGCDEKRSNSLLCCHSNCSEASWWIRSLSIQVLHSNLHHFTSQYSTQVICQENSCFCGQAVRRLVFPTEIQPRRAHSVIRTYVFEALLVFQSDGEG